MTLTLFHGGPLDSESFGGHTFWTRNHFQAADYTDGGEIWTLTLDKAAEKIVSEDDYLPRAYSAAESDEENWALQTEAIVAAVADGATVVLCDDGWVIVNAGRLNPRLVTLDEAAKLY